MFKKREMEEGEAGNVVCKWIYSGREEKLSEDAVMQGELKCMLGKCTAADEVVNSEKAQREED